MISMDDPKPPIQLTGLTSEYRLSDINHDAGEFREKADTRNIAYSVKLNLDHLIRGERDKAEPQWNEMPELDGPVSREYIV